MNRTINQAIKGISLLGILAATALQSAPAQAAPSKKHYSVNERQKNQQKRIFAGVHRDSLTNHEAIQLEKQAANIARVEARKRQSGDKFTKQERLNIQRRQNRTSREIYQQKHDRQHR